MKLYTRVALYMVLALGLAVSAMHLLIARRVRASAEAAQHRQIAATAVTIAEQLRQGPKAAPARSARLAVLTKRVGLGLSVRPTSGADPTTTTPSFTKLDGERVATIALSSDELLVVGPLPALPRFVGWALLGLGIAIAIVLIAAFLIVVPIVRRLRALERGTTLLRSGELTARVPVEGSDAIASLGTSINHMAAEIERLIENRNQLLQAVSHEFRTPIARLRFAVEMLATDETASSRESRVDAIDKNLTELDALVEEILTYGKLDSDAAQFRTESIEVGAAVTGIVTSTQAVGTKIDIDVVGHDKTAPIVIANRRYFSRVVENLVLNAIRHAKSKVRVEYQTVGDVVLIVIHDDGPGVPKEERDRVWEPFARLDASRSRDSGGFGLGLAIVRQIMDWHGGAAHVDESQLGGAMFVTSWPIRDPNEES